jgi:hypothetical protein
MKGDDEEGAFKGKVEWFGDEKKVRESEMY